MQTAQTNYTTNSLYGQALPNTIVVDGLDSVDQKTFDKLLRITVETCTCGKSTVVRYHLNINAYVADSPLWIYDFSGWRCDNPASIEYIDEGERLYAQSHRNLKSGLLSINFGKLFRFAYNLHDGTHLPEIRLYRSPTKKKLKLMYNDLGFIAPYRPFSLLKCLEKGIDRQVNDFLLNRAVVDSRCKGLT